MASLVHSPLDFLANVATEQKNSLQHKKHLSNADLAVSPTLYLKALFMQHCPHVQLPLRFNKNDLLAPKKEDMDSYDMEVCRAVRSCNLEKVRELHQAGHSLDACNKFGESLIHMACRRGDVRIVRYLIEEAKVRVDVRDDFGRNILHDATWTSSCNLEVVDVLLKVVPPEYWIMEDQRGHTPFEYARREHWGPWLKYLRKNEGLIVRKLAFVP